jgi:hypothetical protein
MAARIRGAWPPTTALQQLIQEKNQEEEEEEEEECESQNGRQKGIPGWELPNFLITVMAIPAPPANIRPSSVAKRRCHLEPGGLLKQRKTGGRPI